jgi:IS30 family transposase
MCYCADGGQRILDEQAANKGRSLKIGHDHRLAAHIEQKSGEARYAPNAGNGEIRAKRLKFEVGICVKTLHNCIDKGIFMNISNKDLPVKRNGEKGRYRQVRRVSLNNLKGRSIEERPENVETRAEPGHREMDRVVGKGKVCLLVTAQRKSRKELLFKLEGKT